MRCPYTFLIKLFSTNKDQRVWVGVMFLILTVFMAASCVVCGLSEVMIPWLWMQMCAAATWPFLESLSLSTRTILFMYLYFQYKCGEAVDLIWSRCVGLFFGGGNRDDDSRIRCAIQLKTRGNGPTESYSPCLLSTFISSSRGGRCSDLLHVCICMCVRPYPAHYFLPCLEHDTPSKQYLNKSKEILWSYGKDSICTYTYTKPRLQTHSGLSIFRTKGGYNNSEIQYTCVPLILHIPYL